MSEEQLAGIQAWRAYLRILIDRLADPGASRKAIDQALFAFNIADDMLAKSLSTQGMGFCSYLQKGLALLSRLEPTTPPAMRSSADRVAFQTSSGLVISSDHPTHAELLLGITQEGILLDRLTAVGWLRGSAFEAKETWPEFDRLVSSIHNS